jgi:uncharacterized phage-associated protein
MNYNQELKTDNKLKALVEYCLLNGSTLTQGVPKTKFFKLVYLCDFANFYYYGKPITDKIYKKRDWGPVPDTLFVLTDEMIGSDDIKISDGDKAKFHRLNRKPEYISYLTEEELKIAKKVCDYWKDRKAGEIINFTHDQRPWALSKEDDIVPYELILQEENPIHP